MKTVTYLALGDSYTIGEQVPLHESFPYQTVQLLRKSGAFSGCRVMAPEVVAKTGWTTDELSAAIDNTVFLPEYDMVSLLIGVNNQYRGRAVDEFEKEFETLLQRACHFAGGIAKNVYVLSIPDWGVTPFAKERDAGKIAIEIDAYNAVCERISGKYNTHFINITSSQRADAADAAFLAADGLHPSGKEYEKWAGKLAGMIWRNVKCKM